MPYKEYKTFDNTTGEIKIHSKMEKVDGIYYIIQNGKTLLETNIPEEAEDYFHKILQMDYYIASKVESYEVYIIL